MIMPGWLAAIALIIAAILVTLQLWPDGSLEDDSVLSRESAKPLRLDARRGTEVAGLQKLESGISEKKASQLPEDSRPPGSGRSAPMKPPSERSGDWQDHELPVIEDEFYDINHDRLNDLHQWKDMAREYSIAELVRFQEVNPDSLDFTEDALSAITEAVGPDLQAYRDLDKRVGEITHAAVRRNIEEGRCEEPRYTETGYPIIPRASSPDEMWTHTRGDHGDYFVRFDKEHNPEVFEMRDRRLSAAEALMVDFRRLIQLYGHEKN